MWTKMVDNFEESNRYCICVLFPTILIKCSFKILEIPFNNQLADFRQLYGFLLRQRKYLRHTFAVKNQLCSFCSIH